VPSMSITPFPTSARTGAGRRAKPGSATSDPSCAAITGSELTVAGRSANPNPAPGYGDHLAIASTWSTPAAPIPSETPHTPSQSGIPRRARHRNGRANLSGSK